MKEINRVMNECYWVGQYFRWDANISYEISLMGRTPERGDLGKKTFQAEGTTSAKALRWEQT